MRQKYAILLACLATILTPTLTVSFGQIVIQRNITMTGLTWSSDLQGFELDGVTPLTQIYWGKAIQPNLLYTHYGIVKNIGTLNLMLSMIAVPDYPWLNCTWNGNGVVLNAGMNKTVTWTLGVGNAPNGTAFLFDATIQGVAV